MKVIKTGTKPRRRRTGNRSEFWQMCGKKQAYSSPQAAQWAAARAKERGQDCHVYQCKYGRHWHIAGGD
jgi:hypothetical protein